MAKPFKIVVALGGLTAAAALAACGSAHIEVASTDSPQIHRGAELFHERCAGCHTLSAAATIGSATKVRDRERVDGPNFNQRKEEVPQVLYALRNGGFSGAIMPQNLATGQDARDIAQFLAKYSGRDATTPSAPRAQPAPGGGTAPGS